MNDNSAPPKGWQRRTITLTVDVPEGVDAVWDEPTGIEAFYESVLTPALFGHVKATTARLRLDGELPAHFVDMQDRAHLLAEILQSIRYNGQPLFDQNLRSLEPQSEWPRHVHKLVKSYYLAESAQRRLKATAEQYRRTRHDKHVNLQFQAALDSLDLLVVGCRAALTRYEVLGNERNQDKP